MKTVLKNVSPRVQAIYDEVRGVKKFPLSIEKCWLFTEAYKANEFDDDILRTAKAQAYMLDNIPINISQYDLIPGFPCAKPYGAEADFWHHGCWTAEGIASVREEGVFQIDDSTAERMYQLYDFWRVRVQEYKALDLYDEEMWNWKKSGYMLPKNKTVEQAAGSGFALSSLAIHPEYEINSIDHAYIIRTGLRDRINAAKKHLSEIRTLEIDNEKTLRTVYALKAMIEADEGLIRFARRHAELAEKMALECDDLKRRQELLDMADSCRRVPEYPAESFRDAIIFFWFIYMTTHYLNTATLGRLDQTLYPYYAADLEKGAIDEELALEYLECFRLKIQSIKSTNGGTHRKKWAGQAGWRNAAIGGVKPDGTDATNDISYLILEAAMRVPTPHHTITLRVHDGTPEKLLMKSLELVRTGIGMPAFVGDNGYITTLVEKRKVPIEVARQYYLIGCLDVNVPEGFGNLYPMTVAALPFDTFLHDGYSPIQDLQVAPHCGDVREIPTYEEFVDRLVKHYSFFFHCVATDRKIRHMFRRNFLQDALIISMFHDGPEVGLGPLDREMPYGLGPNQVIAVGIVNVGNSLAVIKKLVYEDKVLTMDELIAALDANWEGERNQQIRKMCLDVPKYGNNEPYVDEIVGDIMNRLIREIETIDSYRGVKFNVSGVSITSHDPGGLLVGATPDGRYAGTILADGGASPTQGSDRCGPTSVLLSTLKLPLDEFNSLLLNQKFTTGALKSDEDLKKLGDLLRIYFANHGKQTQLNVVDQETLLKAQERPEEYQDLVVRVAGYSAYFVTLSPNMQNDLINRTSNENL